MTSVSYYLLTLVINNMMILLELIQSVVKYE